MPTLPPEEADAAADGTASLAVLEDEVLVLAALGGVPGASEQLFERWFDAGYDVALGIAQRPDLAAAAVQEAMLKCGSSSIACPPDRVFRLACCMQSAGPG